MILLGCVLLLAAAGCGKSDQYPSAPAPPTIKAPPPGPSKAVGVDDDDDLDDDDEEGEDQNASSTGKGGVRNLGRGRAMAAAGVGARPGPVRTGTINGHPGGPKAAVFNAVTNNAMPNAAPCFAKRVSGGGTVSVVVRMTVGNSGSVEKAEAVSGDKDPTLRKCLCDVVRRLTYPAFKGSKVTKTIPFTAVGGLSK